MRKDPVKSSSRFLAFDLIKYPSHSGTDIKQYQNIPEGENNCQAQALRPNPSSLPPSDRALTGALQRFTNFFHPKISKYL